MLNIKPPRRNRQPSRKMTHPYSKPANSRLKTSTRAENQKDKNQPKRGSDIRASTQVVALTGHDLIQTVPQQTVNIVRDNSLVRQPTADQMTVNIGQNPVTQTTYANERVEMYSRVSPPQGHQNNSSGCVISDTPAADTRAGMVIETPGPGPSSQSGIGGYSGIGASAIRTPQ